MGNCWGCSSSSNPFCGWLSPRVQRVRKQEKALAVILVALYLLNKSQGLFFFLPFGFGSNHFNDLLAGILFPLYLNAVFSCSKYSFSLEKSSQMFLVSLVCGLCFEFVYPLLNPASTSDLLDCVCYLVGSQIYFLFRKFISS